MKRCNRCGGEECICTNEKPIYYNVTGLIKEQDNGEQGKGRDETELQQDGSSGTVS